MKFDHPFPQFQKQKDEVKLFSSKTFSRIVAYFFQGLLLVVPIAVSIWVIYNAFQYIDELFPFRLGRGLGFLIIIGGITILGFLGSLFITRPILAFIEKVISNVPVLKFLYSTIRDFMEAFVGEKKRFTEGVLVTLDKDNGIERPGFITSKDLSRLGLPGKVAVYMPFSYQFAGDLLIVPAESVRPLPVSGADMMKFIVSGGVTEFQDGNPAEENDVK
jgi:uncharacterized membrane protein